jgi:hypothetical protein
LARGADSTEHSLNQESALEELFRKILKTLNKFNSGIFLAKHFLVQTSEAQQLNTNRYRN